MEKFKRKGHEGARFFVGPEIEQTPAFGKKTLFVVGLQDTVTVERLAREHKTPHIFLSANRSFDSVEFNNGVYMVGDTLASDWEKQIHELLDKGFMVSLDYPAHKHVHVLQILNKGIWQSRNFVPILSISIPHVNTTCANLTVKIDDINFGETNPGVWCMNHHEVTDSNRFTRWEDYGDDMILTDEQIGSLSATRATPTLGSDTDFKKFIADKKSEMGEIEGEYDITSKQIEEAIDAIKNDSSLGLDTNAKSQLKPDQTEQKVTIADAIEAYAEGAKDDPLGKESTKKPVKKK